MPPPRHSESSPAARSHGSFHSESLPAPLHARAALESRQLDLPSQLRGDNQEEEQEGRIGDGGVGSGGGGGGGAGVAGGGGGELPTACNDGGGLEMNGQGLEECGSRVEEDGGDGWGSLAVPFREACALISAALTPGTLVAYGRIH